VSTDVHLKLIGNILKMHCTFTCSQFSDGFKIASAETFYQKLMKYTFQHLTMMKHMTVPCERNKKKFQNISPKCFSFDALSQSDF
jgi:hypothetical protein